MAGKTSSAESVPPRYADRVRKARDFVSRMIDDDYCLEQKAAWIDTAMGERRPTYITVKGGKIVYRYEYLWTNDKYLGECYMPHRNGKPAPYPKRLDDALEYMWQWQEGVSLMFPALSINEVLDLICAG